MTCEKPPYRERATTPLIHSHLQPLAESSNEKVGLFARKKLVKICNSLLTIRLTYVIMMMSSGDGNERVARRGKEKQMAGMTDKQYKDMMKMVIEIIKSCSTTEEAAAKIAEIIKDK